jgi:hypothetical protein
MSSAIQSILFNKKYFNLYEAINWILLHNFKLIKIHETKNSYRFRQLNPDDFDRFITKKLKKYKGISLIIGFY